MNCLCLINHGIIQSSHRNLVKKETHTHIAYSPNACNLPRIEKKRRFQSQMALLATNAMKKREQNEVGFGRNAKTEKDASTLFSFLPHLMLVLIHIHRNGNSNDSNN